ncbi:TPA: hypothetical protein P1K35_003808, partial [Providencia rettgeri]
IKPNESNDVLGWLRKVGGYFTKKENGYYKNIKVKYNDENNKSRTVTLQTNNIKLEAIEKTFIKKSIISGFDFRLSSSYDKINIEIVDKLNEII